MPAKEQRVNPKAAIPLPSCVILGALEYDETSPSFIRWKTRPLSHFDYNIRICNAWNTRFAGKMAGNKLTVNGFHYWRVCLDNRRYRSHRIVFFLCNGVDLGAMHVDHIDGNGLNNNIKNLRPATNSENQKNKRMQSTNSSGTTGVRWHKPRKKWEAYITINSRFKSLGLFVVRSEANAARESAEMKYFGEFSYKASRKLNEDP